MEGFKQESHLVRIMFISLHPGNVRLLRSPTKWFQKPETQQNDEDGSFRDITGDAFRALGAMMRSPVAIEMKREEQPGRRAMWFSRS